MFFRLGAATGILLSVAAGCGPADSREASIKLQANPGDSYTVEYKFMTTYTISGEGTVPASKEELNLSQIRSYKCTKAEANKSTWSVKTEEIKATGTGSMAAQAATMVESQKGQSKSFTRDSQNILADLANSNTLEAVFPNRPVSAGDQWRGEVNMQGVKMVMVHTFDGFEEVNGKDAILITSVPDSPTVRVIKPIRIWIERSTGWPLKGEGKFEMSTDPNYSTLSEVSLIRKK